MDAVEAGGLSGSVAAPVAARRSTTQGLTVFLSYAALYAVTWVGAIAPLYVATSLLSAILNGVFIAMLFIVGHDCCHGALVPGRSLNRWLGRIAFVPLGHSVSLWRLAHNGLHHRRNNLVGVDPVWAPMSLEDYRSASPARRLLERIYRGPAGPVFYYYGAIWISWMLVPTTPKARARWKQHLPDSLFAMAGFAGIIVATGLLGRWLAPGRPLWLELMFGWALPFAVWNYLAAFSFYLNHTHPDIPWFVRESDWREHGGSVRGTAHVRMPIDILPLYSAAMAHPAHHADPMVPAWKLPESQRALKARHAAEAKAYTLSVAEYLRTVRACKLFDHDRMCWTDFAGNPTTPRLVSPAS